MQGQEQEQNPISFTMSEELKRAISKLADVSQDGTDNIVVELKGKVVDGDVVISELDSKILGDTTAPHCWHVLSERVESGEL